MRGTQGDPRALEEPLLSPAERAWSEQLEQTWAGLWVLLFPSAYERKVK